MTLAPPLIRNWWKPGAWDQRGMTLAQYLSLVLAEIEANAIAVRASPETNFIDLAATTRCAVGDRVAIVLDESGRGNNASQATEVRRPRLQLDEFGNYYWDYLGAGTPQWFSHTPILTTFTYTAAVAVRYVSTALQYAASSHRLASPGSNQPVVALIAHNGALGYRLLNRNDAAASSNILTVTRSPPVTVVQAARSLGPGLAVTQYIDNVPAGAGTQPVGPVTIDAAAIGVTPFDNSLNMEGRIYGVTLIADVLDDYAFLNLQRLVGASAGVAI